MLILTADARQGGIQKAEELIARGMLTAALKGKGKFVCGVTHLDQVGSEVL